MSSVNSPLSQTGKLITIYPNSKLLTKTIMKDIYNYFGNLPGIEILSDRSFKNTQYIWYRWGMHTLDETISDSRLINGNIPEGITDLYPCKNRYITGNELQKNTK